MLNYGDYVVVYDTHGHVECRGDIVGISRNNPPFYDVEPRGEWSMAKRFCSIPASRIRLVSKVSAEPKNVRDLV